MRNLILFIFCISFYILSSCAPKPVGKHLFILSGQSNMARLDPEESFIPTLQEKYGTENIIVVKDALGGKPIRRWYKDWKPVAGNELTAQPDLYDTLMNKVYPAIENEKVATVTFIWMQGERDAREQLGEVYEESLIGLHQQISDDLERTDVNYIIGRLSDFDMQNDNYAHWTMIRDIQVKVGESNPRFHWINTDDLNDGLDHMGKEIQNDLHMSAEGYILMGERFATQAIRLIENHD